MQQVLLILSVALFALIENVAACDGGFMILQRPASSMVVYSCLPSTRTRQLFWNENVAVQKIAVDQKNGRLFMIDSKNARIVWTNLIVSGDGTKLMTDGYNHIFNLQKLF